MDIITLGDIRRRKFIYTFLKETSLEGKISRGGGVDIYITLQNSEGLLTQNVYLKRSHG